MRFTVREVNDRPLADFPDEKPPREWLLSLFLEEARLPDNIEFFGESLAKAQAGIETLGISGNGVGVDIYTDRMVIEELFPSGGDDAEPESTEITLADAEKLLRDWQVALAEWRATNPA
jgi:hypothetical protein